MKVREKGILFRALLCFGLVIIHVFIAGNIPVN